MINKWNCIWYLPGPLFTSAKRTPNSYTFAWPSISRVPDPLRLLHCHTQAQLLLHLRLPIPHRRMHVTWALHADIGSIMRHKVHCRGRLCPYCHQEPDGESFGIKKGSSSACALRGSTASRKCFKIGKRLFRDWFETGWVPKRAGFGILRVLWRRL
jgi:hypothetical protein